MKKRILVLDNATDRTVYHPVEEWARAFGKVPFDAVHVPSDASIPSLGGYTHVLLTGSEASLLVPEPWFDVEADVVRDAADRGTAVFGSCFGHQMLAWALSGPDSVRRAPIPELGWVAVNIIASDPLVSGLPTPWHSFSAHLDEVVHPPEPWRILAANEACAVQAMRYGDRPVWGIQPHPETTPEEAKSQMRIALGRYPQYEQEIRRAIDSPVRDDRMAARLMAAFLAFEGHQP